MGVATSSVLKILREYKSTGQVQSPQKQTNEETITNNTDKFVAGAWRLQVLHFTLKAFSVANWSRTPEESGQHCPFCGQMVFGLRMKTQICVRRFSIHSVSK
jgi:hypothetical protein